MSGLAGGSSRIKIESISGRQIQRTGHTPRWAEIPAEPFQARPVPLGSQCASASFFAVFCLVAFACAPDGATTTSTVATLLPSSTTTTTLVTTTTTIPVASTVPFEDPQEVDLLFDVTGIESGSIAGYAGAGTNHDEVATFHAGTVALQATGRTDESIDGTMWRELWMGGGSTAWVDDAFLSLNETAIVTFADTPCSRFGTPAARSPAPARRTASQTTSPKSGKSRGPTAHG